MSNLYRYRIAPTVMTMSKADRSLLIRLTAEQKAALDQMAHEAGMRRQAFIELQLFGEIRQRDGRGPQPYLPSQHEELPMTG